MSQRALLACAVVVGLLISSSCTSSTRVASVGEAEPDDDLAAASEPSDGDASRSDADTESPPPPAEDQSDVSSPPATGGVNPLDVEPGTAVVELLDAGDEPRRELRFEIAGSCRETMTVSQVQEITQSIDGDPLPSAGPITTLTTVTASVVQVGADYQITTSVVAAEVGDDTPPEIASVLNEELANTIGLTTSSRINPRGVQVPRSANVSGAEGLGPLADLVDSLNTVQAPFPEEAVGVGARWRTVSVIELQGMPVATIVETELVSVDGTLIGTTATGTQQVAAGTEMTVPGSSAEVIEWDVATTGQTTADLATINPLASTSTTTGSQVFDVGGGLGTTLLEQELFTELSTSTEPEAGCTGRSSRP